MITFSTATNLLLGSWQLAGATNPRKPRIHGQAGKNGLVMKGLAVRPTLPDIGAVVRSLLGVLIVAGAALHWGGAGTATAAAGAAAIAGAVALQDSPRGRFRLVVCVALAMGAAVLLAASFGRYGLVFAGAGGGVVFRGGDGLGGQRQRRTRRRGGYRAAGRHVACGTGVAGRR